MLSLRSILLVEDDCVDVMAVKRVFRDLHVTNELVHAENGEEALRYLQDPGHEAPCLILLDLNMPKMGGLEFLQIVKADPGLQVIPVIVVTTSGEDQDKTRSFESGAAAYVIKCTTYGEFRERMRIIESYVGPVASAVGMATSPCSSS
jgi:CheY-like chemotaxis protein